MSRDAQAILEACDHLPPADRDEVVRELLRRVAASDHDAFGDGELVSLAGSFVADAIVCCFEVRPMQEGAAA